MKLDAIVDQFEQAVPGFPVAPLADVSSELRKLAQEVRRIAMNLRPAILDDLGLIAAVGWLSREFESSHRGIRVARQIDAQEGDIPASLKTAIFRILQECLNNVAKHSGSRIVRITLNRDGDELRLAVEDEGKGFDISGVLTTLESGGHLGIANMRQRANSSGGSLTIKTTPGAGTAIHCAWPMLIR